MAGPHSREPYNSKARQSTAGSRKKGKVRKNDWPSEPEANGNPNADVITLKSPQQKESEKKEKILRELAAQSDTKWSSQKKKRLEKYIHKKLKKEERVLILGKLSKTQASLPSAVLQSSATLGTGKPLTHQEQQARAEDILIRKTILGRSHKRKRHQDKFDVVEKSTDREEEDEEKEEDVALINDALPKARDGFQAGKEEVVNTASTVLRERSFDHQSSVGSALQRNPDGSVVPTKFRAKSKVHQSVQRRWGKSTVQEDPSESDSSFDSSNSDTDESENRENEVTKSADFSGGASESETIPPPAKEKRIGFKEWAIKQLSAAKGFEPPTVMEETSLNDDEDCPLPKKKRRLEGEPVSHEKRGPLGEDLRLPSTSFTREVLNGEPSSSGVKVVEIKRPPEVEEARILLPIVTEEQPIMEAILLNPVVIICGETGSGKTTQVPQFLYEGGFGTPGSENPGMIGITQPRRVAAMSMAARVGYELSLTSSRVSYQIRYDATVSPSTSIKFMTDGVLLRELATDFLLTKYSVIIIDEAHERSINTDILIGVLSRVIKLREDMWKKNRDSMKPLRLVIMSATMRVSDFAENKNLFASAPPIINVAARQHPVTIHFSRRTYPDYVTQAIKKASQIHTRLPPGGILIFLTGQAEIMGVCRRLEAKFGKKVLEDKRRKRVIVREGVEVDHMNLPASKPTINAALADVEVEEIDLGYDSPDNLALDIDDDGSGNLQELEDLESGGDEEQNTGNEFGLDDTDIPMHIVPLYSLLSNDKQMQVFEPPPEGCRLVVVSTNIAETSLTIPGIRYVVDCGRAKERHYDTTNGIQSFQVSWISKASASQRAGRAGRTGPGHCFRLYSSAVFEHYFEKFATPEIRRIPIEGVVLQMKSMHLDAVINFPFPTPPNKASLQKAEKTLVYLGALKPSMDISEEKGSRITDLGRAMALFPLSPRFSRMLVSGQQHDCLPYVICIISALSVGDPFIYEDALADSNTLDDNSNVPEGLNKVTTSESERRLSVRKAFFRSQHVHASLGNFTSDMFKVLSVIGAYEYAGGGQNFCEEHFVRPKAMEEIHKLRAQISSIVHANFPQTDPRFIPRLPPPNDHQIKVLRQLLTAGFIDQIAVRKDLVDRNDSSGTQFSTSKNVPYRALGVQEDVYIHPTSVLANSSPPNYLVYHEVVRTSRVYLKGLTKIHPTWLSTLGKDTLCTFSKPMKNNVGTFMMIPKFGPEGWELPAIKANGNII